MSERAVDLITAICFYVAVLVFLLALRALGVMV